MRWAAASLAESGCGWSLVLQFRAASPFTLTEAAAMTPRLCAACEKSRRGIAQASALHVSDSYICVLHAMEICKNGVVIVLLLHVSDPHLFDLNGKSIRKQHFSFYCRCTCLILIFLCSRPWTSVKWS